MTGENGLLHLYEEILLLALHDEKGIFQTGWLEYLAAGALLAELILSGSVSVEDSRRRLVTPAGIQPTGDRLLDEVSGTIAAAKRRASIQTHIGRIARMKKLRNRAAERLVERGILRLEKSKGFLGIVRSRYPEADPGPEREVLDRLNQALFADEGSVEGRTAVLVSLLKGSDLLAKLYSRKDLAGRKERIEQITAGELTGKATRELIAACRTAILIAAIMPAVVGSSNATRF